MKSVLNEIAYILRDQDIFIDKFTYSYLTDEVSISVSHNSNVAEIQFTDKEFSDLGSEKLALRIAKVVWLGQDWEPSRTNVREVVQ